MGKIWIRWFVVVVDKPDQTFAPTVKNSSSLVALVLHVLLRLDVLKSLGREYLV